jgi:hypothetical protein
MADEAQQKVITPEAVISYPALFTPKPNDKGELFFSCALVFEEGTDLSKMEAAALAAGKAKFGAKFNRESPAYSWPFRTDVEEKGYPAGSTFFNCKSKGKPGVVDRYADSDGKPRPITDAEEVYAGAKVRASVRFYAFEKNGKKGVAVALNNVQKLGDGPRLDSRMRAEDEFDAEEGEASALS